MTKPSFLQDPSSHLSPKQPETDIYDNVSKPQDYADKSDEISISSPHESSQSGQNSQTDSSSHAEHKESSKPPHSNIRLADNSQPNASGPEENSSFQQISPDSKAGGIKLHELQDLCDQVQQESDGSDKEAQLGEGFPHIQPQSDLEAHVKDFVDREIQENDPTNHPNSLLDDELSISASDVNRSATESSKEGIYSYYLGCIMYLFMSSGQYLKITYRL